MFRLLKSKIKAKRRQTRRCASSKLPSTPAIFLLVSPGSYRLGYLGAERFRDSCPLVWEIGAPSGRSFDALVICYNIARFPKVGSAACALQTRLIASIGQRFLPFDVHFASLQYKQEYSIDVTSS